MFLEMFSISPNKTRRPKKSSYLFNDYYCKNKKLKFIVVLNLLHIIRNILMKHYDEYDKKNDEIDLSEKHVNVNINMYIQDEPELLQIDRKKHY